jgi:hypothetical protein
VASIGGGVSVEIFLHDDSRTFKSWTRKKGIEGTGWQISDDLKYETRCHDRYYDMSDICCELTQGTQRTPHDLFESDSVHLRCFVMLHSGSYLQQRINKQVNNAIYK